MAIRDMYDYFETVLEEEYDSLMTDDAEEAKAWVDTYHTTEYDTADYCTELLDNYVSDKILKDAILGTVNWEKIWKHLMSYIENWEG